jgi:anaphase-promoting complex subunit 1
MRQSLASFTPRIAALMQLLSIPADLQRRADRQVEALVSAGVDRRMLETLPEALLAILKEPIVQCQSNPPTTWSSSLLKYIARDDLNLLVTQRRMNWAESGISRVYIPLPTTTNIH